jgi:hypothetical protein
MALGEIDLLLIQLQVLVLERQRHQLTRHSTMIASRRGMRRARYLRWS